VGGEVGQVVDQGGQLVGADPPDDVGLGPFGEGCGDRGLADAAEAGDRLGEDGGPARCEAGQELVAAGEPARHDRDPAAEDPAGDRAARGDGGDAAGDVGDGGVFGVGGGVEHVDGVERAEAERQVDVGQPHRHQPSSQPEDLDQLGALVVGAGRVRRDEADADRRPPEVVGEVPVPVVAGGQRLLVEEDPEAETGQRVVQPAGDGPVGRRVGQEDVPGGRLLLRHRSIVAREIRWPAPPPSRQAREMAMTVMVRRVRGRGTAGGAETAENTALGLAPADRRLGPPARRVG
jgi:hypothetical protein